MKTCYLGVIFLLLLMGCSSRPAFVKTPPSARGTATLVPVPAGPAQVPDVKPVARAYLDAWKAEDYSAMYSLLTSVSQDALSEEDFQRHYRGVASEAALSGLDYEILSWLVRSTESAQVSYRVNLHSVMVGDITAETLMNLSLESGQWRVEWADTLVLPQLAGGNYLNMQRFTPARANIYDRLGHALVAPANATAIGLLPAQVDPSQADFLFSQLAQLTGLHAETIRARYENASPDWYIQLGEVPASEVERQFDALAGLSGLVMKPYKSRFYVQGGVAPHVVGYVSPIQAEEAEAYQRKGYQPDERVGRLGLEKWGEQYLAGKRGGALYVIDGQGQLVTQLGETPAQPAQAIFTTLERDFQAAVRQALSGFRGAVVVLERDTGRVLALASAPGFDPNGFEPVNFNYSTLLQEIYGDPAQPLFNRAALGQYPLGSVFKTITMAAGLESGLYSASSVYQCGYTFKELEGVTLYDWTWEHFQQDRKTQPSGSLTLSEGLIRSCNPFFYHIGLDLYNREMSGTIPEMARGFGLGSPTGIQVIDEETGQVPEPLTPIDATNLAIGQGELLVTPLQVASFMAAIGNGGTLYRPQVVEKVAPPDGDPTFTFTPAVRGKLPVTPETLDAIQEALVGVIRSDKPRGTAWHRFTGLDLKVAGKTGTATAGYGLPHAWFAGYTFEGRADRPDIAVAVVIENIGEGSDYAAPVFRRVVELYFSQYLKRYWWETEIGVVRTPLLGGPETVTPGPEATPAP